MGARAVALAALALVACERTSTKYCELHGLSDPTNCGFMDAPIDTPKTCSVDTDCTPGRCNTMAMQCVQCLSGSDCSSMSPFCDPQTYTCAACRTNADCPDSLACLPTGQCAASTDVIYADGTNGNDMNGCTMQAPCKTIGRAQKLLSTSRTIIKLTGAFSELVVFTKQTATILADPGTTLSASGGSGIGITFAMNPSNVQIYDLEIAHTMKSAVVVTAGNTLSLNRVSIHDAGGIAVTSAGSLTLSRSKIYSNPAGGLSLSGAFQVTNNFIVHNGSDAPALGGVLIAMAGQSSFEFNTVADNDAKAGAMNAGGVECTASGFHAPNNIIARNALMGDATVANANTAGTACNFDGTTIQADVTGLDFVDPDTTFNYHIGSASSAKDMAGVPSLISEDIDSQPRPYGPGKDRGADEYHP